MNHPLINRLSDELGYPSATEHTIDALIKSHEYLVLFFTGQAERHADTGDVAVVLPELVKHYAPKLHAAVVLPENEAPLKARFPFSVWPALVFLRRGVQIGEITRIQDWADYLSEIDALLKTPEQDSNRIDSIALQ